MCEGMPDGKNIYPGQPFDIEYVVCQNGTVTNSTQTCAVGVFDPIQRICTMDYTSELCTSLESYDDLLFIDLKKIVDF